MSIEVILGPPGTGKTTALLDLVDECLTNNIAPGKIGFISFTRRSVNEARDRAAERFNMNPKSFDYFRTIHSLSFRQLGMSASDVVQRRDLVEVGDTIGIPIKGYQQMDREIYEMQRGDQLVFLESLSRLLCEEYDKTYSDLNPDFSKEEFFYYIDTYKAYKRSHLLYDFTDMLVKFFNEGTAPNLDALFIDEAQDLCPLQWRIVEFLIKHADETYVAGDDDQAIFRWSGADVDYFINLAKENKNRVLNHSYRLPIKVHHEAVRLADRIQIRTEKKFTSTDEEGSVNYTADLENIDMDEGQWLILVRNGYLEKPVVEYLRSCGYAFEGRYDKPVESEVLKAALIWERLRKEEKIKVSEAKLMLSFISRKNMSGNVKRALSGRRGNEIITLDNIRKWCGLHAEGIWHEVLDKISIEDREYYIAARKRGESFVGQPRIRVSTIHGAKGSESQHVVLFTDISARTYRSMINNMDDELRVFYVGVTRAKEKLWIVSPSTNYYFDL